MSALLEQAMSNEAVQNLGILVGVVAAAFAGLAAVSGGIWWLSATYALIRSLRSDVAGLRNEIAKLSAMSPRWTAGF
jgi:hypothetical protein